MTILWFFFTLFVSILMLNLLIAMMARSGLGLGSVLGLGLRLVSILMLNLPIAMIASTRPEP